MSRHLGRIRWVSYAVLTVSLLTLLRTLPLHEGVTALRTWVEGLGVWGPVAFGLIYVAAVVTMVPASLLTLAAGATFGLLVGTLTVTIAANVGAALALLIARYLARDKVERFAGKRPRFAAIDRAIDEGGWKIVALLRLSPAVPFNVQNYLYGLTSIPFSTCVLISLVAMLPGTFLYVYLGHAAGSVTGVGGARSPAQWALLGVGLVATLVVSIYITRLAQRKLREQTQIDNAADSPPIDPSPNEAADQRGPAVVTTLITAVAAITLAGCAVASIVRPDEAAQFVRSLLPLGPPRVTMVERYDNLDDGPSIDHTVLDDLLRRFVDEEGWVDYDALAQEADELDAYLQTIAEAPFAELGRDEKLALLINAYNACTLRLILDHWPLDSIRDIPAAERWEAQRWNVGGNVWSLEQIEHEQIRPNFREPRIHFALVCAAVGCPPLANEAFVAERLDAQLQRQAEYVHTHTSWVQVEADQNRVALTPLYRWYADDFLQVADSVVSYAAQFSPAVQKLQRTSRPVNVTYLEYDWSINSRENRRPR